MVDFDHDGAQDIVVLNGGGNDQPLDLNGPDQLLTLGGLAAAYGEGGVPNELQGSGSRHGHGSSTSGGSGCWVKSNALSIGFAIRSRTVGRGSGRPSVFGSRRCPPTNRSSIRRR